MWFEALVIDSGLETKALLSMGYPKMLEFSACSVLRTEFQKGKFKMQVCYLEVVMDITKEQNERYLIRLLFSFATQIQTKNIFLCLYKVDFL